MNDAQQTVDEIREKYRALLAENVDLKIQIEVLKARVQSLECVAHLLGKEIPKL